MKKNLLLTYSIFCFFFEFQLYPSINPIEKLATLLPKTEEDYNFFREYCINIQTMNSKDFCTYYARLTQEQIFIILQYYNPKTVESLFSIHHSLIYQPIDSLDNFEQKCNEKHKNLYGKTMCEKEIINNNANLPHTIMVENNSNKKRTISSISNTESSSSATESSSNSIYNNISLFKENFEEISCYKQNENNEIEVSKKLIYVNIPKNSRHNES